MLQKQVGLKVLPPPLGSSRVATIKTASGRRKSSWRTQARGLEITTTRQEPSGSADFMRRRLL